MLHTLGGVGGAVEPAGAELAAAALRDATANLITYVAQRAVVRELVPEGDSWEADSRAAITARYRVVRPFMQPLATVLPLHAATGDADERIA